MSRVLWLIISFAAWYGFTLALLHLSHADEVLGQTTGSLAARILSAAADHEVEASIDEYAVWLSIPEATTPVEAPYLNRNLPMFIAIVFTLATSYRLRFFAIVTFGSIVLFLLDSLSLAATLWKGFGDLLPRPPIYHAFQLFAFWSIGGWSVAPLFIGALIAAPLLQSSEDAADPANPADGAPETNPDGAASEDS